MTNDFPSVCLVSMPFMPLLTPSLGVSTLKAGLQQAKIPCDVWYGSLALLEDFSAHADPSDALLDYTLIATLEDLGDVFFAQSLWNDTPLPVAEAFSQLVTAARANVPEIEASTLNRLLAALKRVDDFLDRAFHAQNWGEYGVIGFSSTFSQQVASLALARLIKRAHPDAFILFGGANCEGEMGHQLLESFPWVDAVLRGEADLTLPDFVRRVPLGRAALAEIPGVIVRLGDELTEGPPASPVTALDNLPLPDFDEYFAQQPVAMLAVDRKLPIETSRGCWWGAVSHCTFCGLNPTGMTFRAKSAQRSIDEFTTQSLRYKARRFEAVDNIIDMQFFRTVLPALEPLGLKVFYETKANLQPWHVEQLSRAGVDVIQPGIEGLNSDILKLMRKGVRAFQNLHLLKSCSLFNVRPLWFYLYGFPHEDEECYWRDIGWMPNLWHLPPPRNANPVLVDRFSPLFSRRESFGIRALRPWGRVSLSYAGLSDQQQARIAYHFHADLPQGNDLLYANALWHAIAQWNRAYAAGAFLSQVSGDGTTLVIDGRDVGQTPRAYLITAAAHAGWQAMSEACTPENLSSALGQEQNGTEMSARDLALTMAALRMQATIIEAPVGGDGMGPLTRVLAEAGLAVEVDGRWLALAVELADGERLRGLHLEDLSTISSQAPSLSSAALG